MLKLKIHRISVLKRKQLTCMYKYKTVGKELGITHSIARRWVKHFETEEIKGLEEKRGKSKGSDIGRPRIHPEKSKNLNNLSPYEYRTQAT